MVFPRYQITELDTLVYDNHLLPANDSYFYGWRGVQQFRKTGGESA